MRPTSLRDGVAMSIDHTPITAPSMPPAAIATPQAPQPRDARDKPRHIRDVLAEALPIILARHDARRRERQRSLND